MRNKKILAAICCICTAVNVTGCAALGTKTSVSVLATEQNEGNIRLETQPESSYPKLEEKALITLGSAVDIEGMGAELLEGNVISITEGGQYIFTGTLEDGMIYIETKETVELTLNGVSVTHSNGPAILGQDCEALYINALEGTENVFSDSSEYPVDDEGNVIAKGTIFSNDDLYFTGEGTLVIEGNYQHAIKSDDSICLESGIFILTAVKDGINANEALLINGGSIDIKSAEEGLEGDTLEVNGGNIIISARDDGMNAGTDLQINGGNFYVTVSNGDGLDSNGTLTISGGTLIIHGARMPEGGIDCDDREFVVTGGTVIATGGVNSSPSAAESTQCCILLGSGNEGDAIGILDGEGNTVFAYTAESSFTDMIVSVSGIEMGNEYTVYSGGSIEGDTDFYGYYADSVYEGGRKQQEFTADAAVIMAGSTTDSMGGRGFRNQDGIPPGNGERPDGIENGGPPEGME